MSDIHLLVPGGDDEGVVQAKAPHVAHEVHEHVPVVVRYARHNHVVSP